MGGFFGLELPSYNNFPYAEGPGCACVSSGRAAFELLLRHMPRPDKIWIPRYICNTVLQAPQRLGIPIAYYSCTDQLVPELPPAGANDLVLLVNYFGLTGSAVAAAAESLPCACIVDATTALYCPPLPGLPAFYSPRKFCGVADGGIAVAPFALQNLPPEPEPGAPQSFYLLERLESGAMAALPGSERSEAALNAAPRKMNRLTRQLLKSIDFEAAAARRLENYGILHEALADINHLQLPAYPHYAPMCYPLVSGIPGLRDSLIDSGIALPVFWPEVIEATDASTTENMLSRKLLPLPLDQRYSEADMKRLISLILA